MVFKYYQEEKQGACENFDPTIGKWRKTKVNIFFFHLVLVFLRSIAILLFRFENISVFAIVLHEISDLSNYKNINEGRDFFFSFQIII